MSDRIDAMGGLMNSTAGRVARKFIEDQAPNWAALFGIMEQAFAVIYHTRPRDFRRQKLIAVGMVFLFTILVDVAVATSAILPALKHIPNLPDFLYSGVATFILQAIVGITAGII